jgi:hypothetical protein|tara:strand:+ start:19876 stop:20028 length:153 start_codon:yes stop_codon:yes gene_type:complete
MESLGLIYGLIGITFGIVGIVFGIICLGRIGKLTKQLREKGILEQDDREE